MNPYGDVLGPLRDLDEGEKALPSQEEEGHQTMMKLSLDARSSPSHGSSRTISLGLAINPRAIATLCSLLGRAARGPSLMREATDRPEQGPRPSSMSAWPTSLHTLTEPNYH